MTQTPLVDVFGFEQPEAKHVDNNDPHPITLKVNPRETVDGKEWEAEYEVTIGHPDTCTGGEDECPIADYLNVVGIDEEFTKGLPDPGPLTDEQLAELDGTVRWLVLTRTSRKWSNADGEEWDVDYDFRWVADPAGIETRRQTA